MEVNPYTDLALGITDQPEQTHINNICKFHFRFGREHQPDFGCNF